MAVQVKRRSHESSYNLLRRFQDVFKKSRVGVLTKKNSHYQKDLSKLEIKRNSLRKLHNRKFREFLIKTGKIVPFMIVFDKLPRNLDEYTVEVAGSSI